MKKALQIATFCLVSMVAMGQEMLQLAPPIVHLDSGIFFQQAEVILELALENSALEYQFLGLDEKPGEGKRYGAPLQLGETGILWARSTAPGFQASNWRRQVLLKGEAGREQCKLLTEPSEKYPGKGKGDLTDGNRGSTAFNAGGWLGFSEEKVCLEVPQEKTWKSIAISYLHDPRSWILGPAQLHLVGTRKGKETVWHQSKIDWAWGEAGVEQRAALLQLGDLPRRTRRKIAKAEVLRLELDPALLPAGHPGAGSKAWIFLDEIILK